MTRTHDDDSMTLRKNNCFTAPSPSASASASASPSLANSLSFASVSPLGRRLRGREGESQSPSSASSDRLCSLEQRADAVRRNIVVPRGEEHQRDAAVRELGAVKGHLALVMGELKGFYAREAGRLEDMRVLKESNRRLEDEVKRLDGVALDLENMLSAAEVRLEKYESGEMLSERTKGQLREVQERLRETEEGLEASAWRIDDLVYQVGMLRECMLEYEGRAVDAEARARVADKVREEAEDKYYAVVEESMRRLEGMEGRVRGLRDRVQGVSSHGSVKEERENGNGNGNGNGKKEQRVGHPTPDSSMGWSRAREQQLEQQLEKSEQHLERLHRMQLAHSERTAGVERKYEAASLELERALAENEGLRGDVSRLSHDLMASKEHTRMSLTSALERIEDEAEAKVEEAKAALELAREQHAAEVVRMEDDLEQKGAIADMQAVEIGELNRALAREQQATLVESQEKKRLVQEKEALCGVVEELKRALETVTKKKNSGVTTMAATKTTTTTTTNGTNKENARVAKATKSIKTTGTLAHGKTPLRSLVQNGNGNGNL